MKSITQPQPLTKLAYDRLRNSILNGSLKAGEIYNEMKLAKELGISRTPVREALLQLSVQGLVSFLPRRGVLISCFTKRGFEEAFELRKAIERAVMDKIASHLDQLDFSKIDNAINSQKTAAEKGDKMAFLNADRAFHNAFANMAGNQLMVNVMENLRDIIHQMGAEGLTQSGRMDEVLDEHSKVVELLRENRGEEAKKAMAYHLDRSMAIVLKQQELVVAESKPSP